MANFMVKVVIFLFGFFVFCLSSFVPHPSSLVYASVPHLINYQGRLTDAQGQPLTGSYPVTFRIYDAETAGNLLWEEAHAGMVIDKGLFSVLLGSVTNLNIPFDKPYFLEIVVSGEVMSPRQRISSSGYAIHAEAAEKYNGPGKVGTKEVDESGLSDGMRPYYDNASGKIKYDVPPSTGFGSWVTKSANTVYRAETDGIVVAYTTQGGDMITMNGYTDSNNPPVTLRQKGAYTSSIGETGCITMPVKKGDYWKVSADHGPVVYWIPIGS